MSLIVCLILYDMARSCTKMQISSKANSQTPNGSFDVCLFDKKLNLHVIAQHKSPIKETNKLSPKMNMSALKSYLSFLVQALPYVCIASSVCLVLTSSAVFSVKVHAVTVLLAAATSHHVVDANAIKTETLLIQGGGVVGFVTSSDTGSVSVWLLLSFLFVYFYEFVATKLYLVKILLSVQTASLCTLVFFRVLQIFDAEVQWMQYVILATTPVVLGCVWHAQGHFMSRQNISA